MLDERALRAMHRKARAAGRYQRTRVQHGAQAGLQAVVAQLGMKAVMRLGPVALGRHVQQQRIGHA